MLHIDQVFAFIAIDEDGDEGIVGYHTTQGWLPMIGADMVRVDQLRPIAEQLAQQTKITIKLVTFTNREEVEVIA